MKRPALALALLCAAAPAASLADEAEDKAAATAYVETAKPQLARGGWFDAIANLRKAVAADPSNVEAAMLLAGAYRDTGEYARASETLAAHTKSAAAQTLAAELLLLRGDTDGAAARAKAAFELDPLALGALV